jgi:hypothetical protein
VVGGLLLKARAQWPAAWLPEKGPPIAAIKR